MGAEEGKKALLASLGAAASLDAEGIKAKEAEIGDVCRAMAEEKDADGIRTLLGDLRPLFTTIPKAKTAKIVRLVLDVVATIPETTELQLTMCKEQVAWAKQERRTFLRQRIEARLVQLLLEKKEYAAALEQIGTLLTEVKRLDDKVLLVDLHLLESKVHFALKNMPKAKAALTAARTAANAIYVPPTVQSSIDLQAGILHAEEKDFKTAYSYFFEAFEQHNALDDPRAVLSLKYVLLAKIMNNNAEDVPTIITSKGGLKYSGPDVDAMQKVAEAYTNRSLEFFEQTLRDYKEQLGEDPIIFMHISALYETLMQQNLLRLIEPYSRVEVSHVAKLIKLPIATVEMKLSKMILDKKLKGTLDQGNGCLIIFDDVPPDQVFHSSLSTIENLGNVVDGLFTKSAKIVS